MNFEADLILDITTISSNHPGSTAGNTLGDPSEKIRFLPKSGHFSSNLVLQLIHCAGSVGKNPGFENAPNSKVKWVHVRAAGCSVPATQSFSLVAQHPVGKLVAQIGQVPHSGMRGSPILGPGELVQ